MTEMFIVANSFAAPFCSDQSTHFVSARTPGAALVQFAKDYTHPFGLYSAVVYESATAYHKGEPALARWLSNHAQAIETRKSMTVLSHGPGSLELDGKAVTVRDPKAGAVV